MRHRLQAVKEGVLVALLTMVSLSLYAYAREDVKEEQVKAAFIFNFAKFVEWPEKTLESNQTINLCIAGQDKVEAALRLLEGKEAQNHTLRIIEVTTEIDRVKELNCHLLFIAQSERKRQLNWLNATSNEPILTVADNLELVKQGGMISLYLESQRVQFVINQSNTQNNGLKMSARMLQLARVPK